MFVTISIRINDVIVTREFNDSECVYDLIEKLKFSLQLGADKKFVLVNEKENKFLPNNMQLRVCPFSYENLKLLEVGKDVLPLSPVL